MANEDQSVTAVPTRRQPLYGVAAVPIDPLPQPSPLTTLAERRDLPQDNYYRSFPGDVHSIVRQAGGVEQPLVLSTPRPPAGPTVSTQAITRGARDVVGPARQELGNTARNVRRINNEVLTARDRLDRVTPPGSRVIEGLGAVDRAIVKNTPQVVAGLSRTLGSVLPREGSFTHRLDVPVVYDDGHGTRLVIPAGAQIVGTPGSLRLTNPSAFLSTGGVTVQAGALDINLGTRQQSAVLDRFRVATSSTSVDLGGLTTRMTAEGAFLARADSVAIDLSHGRSSIRMTGAQLSAEPGVVRAGFESLAVNTPGLRVSAGLTGISSVIRPDGTTALRLEGRDLNIATADHTFSAGAQSSFEIAFDKGGQLADITARGSDVRYSDRSTGLQATGAFLQTSFDQGGRVTSINGGSDRFNLVTGNGDKLDLTGGRIAVSRDGEAVLLHASAASGRYVTDRGVFDLGRDGTLDMRMTRDLTTVTGTANAFTYADGRGRLAITNGRIDGAFGQGRDTLRFTGDNVRYNGQTGPGQVTDINVNAATAEITRDGSGATRLTMSGRDFGMTIDGHRLAIANAQQVAVQTTPNGSIASIDAFLPGRSSFVSNNGDTRIAVEDLSARYSGGATEHLRLSFSRGEVDIRSLGLYGSAANVQAGFRLDEQGRLAGARIDVGSLDAHHGDTYLRVNNREGESVRLVTRFDGGQFREALLRIPQGGEVVVGSNDGALRLGQQVTRLSQGADGALRLQSRDFEAAGFWRDVSVDARGRNFDATLAGGDLRLNNIQGTTIAVRNRDWNVNLNVSEINNVLVRAATITSGGSVTGPITGATVTLTPTADNSRITARLSASYQGHSFTVDVDNARQLEGLAMARVNQAQVLLRDPSGQGRLRLESGPFSIAGQGQIGAVVTYQPYRAGLFTESMFNTLGDFQLGDHIRMNTKGTVSLGFYNPADPLWGGVSIMPPRVVDPHADPLSHVHQPLVPTDAVGVLFTGGVQHRTADGGREALGLYGGLVPGSTVNATFQGDARLFHTIPLGPSVDIPTTVTAGVRYEIGNRDGMWAAIAGAQANVAGLVNTPYIAEPAKIGGHVGLSYAGQNREYSAAATYTPGGGAGIRLGLNLKF